MPPGQVKVDSFLLTLGEGSKQSVVSFWSKVTMMKTQYHQGHQHPETNMDVINKLEPDEWRNHAGRVRSRDQNNDIVTTFWIDVLNDS